MQRSSEVITTARDRQNDPEIHVQENSAYAITKDSDKVEVMVTIN